MVPSEFEQYYTIFTKDLGFSQVINATTAKQVTGWIEYMDKDIDKTLHKMNALTAITSKDIPKEITDKIILKKHIKLMKINNLQKILSNYNNIHAPNTTSELQKTSTTHQLV